jgi:ring-1,2-phenylacetyl-CoA epoxidase subunit PaaE
MTVLAVPEPTPVAAEPRDAVDLVVRRVRRLTPSAVEVTLDPPAARRWTYLPGQYLPVVVPVDGRDHPRCYSLTSLDGVDDALAVVVKRVDGGTVSPRVVDHLRAGQRLRVRPPAGHFTVDPDPAVRRHLVLFAGGSGITPIYAIARAVLRTEPASTITLIYGSTRAEEVILREEIDALRAGHPDRLVVRHVLDEGPPIGDDRVGRLDEAGTAALVREHATGDTRFFLCGPGPMIEMVRRALRGLGVHDDAVHVERFTAAGDPASGDPASGAVTMTVTRPYGPDAVLAVEPGRTLLETLEGAEIRVPWSCRVGDCGTCQARLVSGRVRMSCTDGLLPEDEAAGQILLCVARPEQDVRVELST